MNATSHAVGSAAGAVSSASSAAINAVGSQVVKYETTTVLKLMRAINVINAIGLMAAGVVMLIAVPTCAETKGCPGPSTAIISFYLVVFGFLLFAFEARIGVLYESFFRKYFGFIYGYWGRFFFILFLGSMTVGIINTALPLALVPILVAAFTLANALLNCFVIRRHPGFQSGEAQQFLDSDRAQAVSQAQAAHAARPNDFGVDSAPRQHASAPYSGGKPTSGGSDNPFAAVVV
jgi:hypothetical protein